MPIVHLLCEDLIPFPPRSHRNQRNHGMLPVCLALTSQQCYRHEQKYEEATRKHAHAEAVRNMNVELLEMLITREEANGQ